MRYFELDNQGNPYCYQATMQNIMKYGYADYLM
jgi:hypothetical protein